MTTTEKTANQEEQYRQRERYLARELSHEEYYLWLSDWIGLTDGMIPASDEQVRASKDPHLNDIPLSSWDCMDGVVRQRAYAKGLSWSLSDTVCCLKAMARRRASRPL